MNINLDEMSKAEIIFALVLSLNKGDCLAYNTRVDMAIKQYDQFVAKGLIPPDKI